jgi:hypothetical protein
VEIDYSFAPTGLASVDPHPRLYALPGWGILVIGCGEKTTIARIYESVVDADLAAGRRTIATLQRIGDEKVQLVGSLGRTYPELQRGR